MVVIIIVVLLVVVWWWSDNNRNRYSWNSFKKKFGDIEGPVKFFNLHETGAERHYVCTPQTVRYSEIFNTQYRDASNTCMIKLTEGPLVDYARPAAGGKPGAYTLKVQTSPWKYQPHFDCVSQWVHVLHGKKVWVLFDLPYEGAQQLALERTFLETHRGKGWRALVEALTMEGIPHEVLHTKAGDVFYLPAGRYHLTENEGREGTIFVNVAEEEEGEDPALATRFQALWPHWSQTGQEIFFKGE